MAKESLELEVKSNIKEAVKDTEKLAGGLKDATKETENLNDAAKEGKKGFNLLSGAVKGVGASLKAAGIGLVIGMFAALKEALERNQKVMNGINTVVTTISNVFNEVVDVLVNVVSWVAESSDRFNGMGKVIGGLTTIFLTPLKLAFYGIKLGVQELMLAWEDSIFGGGDIKRITELRGEIVETRNNIEEIGTAVVDAGKDIYENFGDAMGEVGTIAGKLADGIGKIDVKKVFETAKGTVEVGNASELAAAKIQGLTEKYDQQAEAQRKIRDNENLTFEERLTASKKLEEILKKQKKEQLEQADLIVAAAKREHEANKDNVELQVKYQEALNERAGVLAQIEGFTTEQQEQQRALVKEQIEMQKELSLEGMSGMQRELAELEANYKEKLKMAKKSGMDTAEITKKYEKQKSAIVSAGINEQLSVYSSFAGALSEMAGENKALAVAQATIDTYTAVTKTLKESTLPYPANIIAAAGIGVQGFNNIRKIMQVDVGGGSSGSAPTPTASTPAPELLSGKFELSGGEQEPIKAYVVTDEMTNSQDQLANIRRRATI